MRALTDTWHMVLIALSVVAMIAGLFGSKDSWLSRLLSRRPIRYLGWLSYGIYLWHYPILHVLPVRGLPFPFKAALVSVLTLVCGALSYHFIENRGKKAQT
jgi:peptidoglycan/LPS O-acetylase OafA/YrhL